MTIKVKSKRFKLRIPGYIALRLRYLAEMNSWPNNDGNAVKVAEISK
jgi:hypothetical protein